MRARKKTALGIDIRGRLVSLALVEKDEHGFRTIAAASGDLPTGEPGGATHAKVLSRLRGQLGRRARRAKAALALSADSMVMQLLDLPKQVPTNVSEFVKNELLQYVALSGKTIVSDFCGVGGGAARHLLAVAADAEEVQEIVRACGAAGVVVEAVEPAMLAYLRASLEHRQDVRRNSDVIVAVLGPRRLTTCVFRQGVLDFVRARDLPLDTSTLRPLCVWLSEELKAVERYHDTQVPQPGRDRQIVVAIHDGVHAAEEITPVLTAAGGMKSVRAVDAWEPSAGPGSTDHGPPPPGASMVAVGAAMTLLGTPADDLKVNLLPKAVTEARSLSKHLLLTAHVSVILFLGIFAAAQLLARATHAMDRDLEQTTLSERFYAAPALLTQERFLDEEISRIRQRLEPLRHVIAAQPRAHWPSLLHSVPQAAPAGVSIVQLHCSDGRTLSLKGLASSCPAVQTFVQNLDGQGVLESVSRVRVQRQQDKDSRLEYQIDCLLKTKEGGPS